MSTEPACEIAQRIKGIIEGIKDDPSYWTMGNLSTFVLPLRHWASAAGLKSVVRAIPECYPSNETSFGDVGKHLDDIMEALDKDVPELQPPMLRRLSELKTKYIEANKRFTSISDLLQHGRDLRVYNEEAGAMKAKLKEEEMEAQRIETYLKKLESDKEAGLHVVRKSSRCEVTIDHEIESTKKLLASSKDVIYGIKRRMHSFYVENIPVDLTQLKAELQAADDERIEAISSIREIECKMGVRVGWDPTKGLVE